MTDKQLAQFKAATLEILDEVGVHCPSEEALAIMRQRRFSDITRQPGPDGGVRDPIEVARGKTEWILENHHPEPLADEQQAELDRILASASRELG